MEICGRTARQALQFVISTYHFIPLTISVWYLLMLSVSLDLRFVSILLLCQNIHRSSRYSKYLFKVLKCCLQNVKLILKKVFRRQKSNTAQIKDDQILRSSGVNRLLNIKFFLARKKISNKFKTSSKSLADIYLKKKQKREEKNFFSEEDRKWN